MNGGESVCFFGVLLLGFFLGGGVSLRVGDVRIGYFFFIYR